MNTSELNGFLLINKPKDITSYGCIDYIKKILKQKIKIGHAGTLDPFATGLLIIAIGRQATKNINLFMNTSKEYVATAKLGELTDTLDCTGTIMQTQEIPPLEQADIAQAIEKLGRQYEQIPPIYSALKSDGVPLYKLAREQKIDVSEIEKIAQTKKRTVTIEHIKLISFATPFFTFNARVSKGTYIRSLANDIAQKMNLCATTYELERTAMGSISLEHAIDLYEFKTIDSIKKKLVQKIAP